MGIGNLFDIARSSIFTYTQALAVTSNNIANSANPNFTRQRVALGSLSPNYSNGLGIGSGVGIRDITRVQDTITMRQIKGYNNSFHLADKNASTLKNIESLFSEPTELGLSNLMNGFFNSWDELGADPSSDALRNNVVSSAQKLTGKIQTVYEGINDVKKSLKSESQKIVSSINSYTQQIQVLNERIYQTSVSGSIPNDLLDQRDVLINELSKVSNINVSIDSNNVANISIGGVFAVDRFHANEFKVEEVDGQLEFRTSDDVSKMIITGGQLKSISDSFNTTLPKYLESIDTISQQIFDTVNAAHSTGSTATDPPQTGINFFESYSDGVFKINETILEDSRFIAASGDGTLGNNSIALEIAKIKDLALIDGNTLSGSYSNLVGDIANTIQLNEQNSSSYGLVLNQLEQQRLEYSAVSLDEEMMNITKFQNAYEAASKLVKVADEMLQTLINLV